MSSRFKEPTKLKQVKIELGSFGSEKVDLPMFDEEQRHETLFLLIKRFNTMVDDGDLMKENTGTMTKTEGDRSRMNNTQKKWKLDHIQNKYRLFKSCLQGSSRDHWYEVLDEAPVFEPAADNYALGNIYSVEHFKTRQKE